MRLGWLLLPLLLLAALVAAILYFRPLDPLTESAAPVPVRSVMWCASPRIQS